MWLFRYTMLIVGVVVLVRAFGGRNGSRQHALEETLQRRYATGGSPTHPARASTRPSDDEPG